MILSFYTLRLLTLNHNIQLTRGSLAASDERGLIEFLDLTRGILMPKMMRL